MGAPHEVLEACPCLASARPWTDNPRRCRCPLDESPGPLTQTPNFLDGVTEVEPGSKTSRNKCIVPRQKGSPNTWPVRLYCYRNRCFFKLLEVDQAVLGNTSS